jgi:hypothetical protein
MATSTLVGDLGSVTTIGTVNSSMDKSNQPSHLKNVKTSRSPVGRGLFKPRLDANGKDDDDEDEDMTAGNAGEIGIDDIVGVTSSLSLANTSTSIVSRKPRKLVGLSGLQNKSPLSPSGVVLRSDGERRNEGGRDVGGNDRSGTNEVNQSPHQQREAGKDLVGLGGRLEAGVGGVRGSVSSYGVDSSATTTTTTPSSPVAHVHTYDQSHPADFYPRVINAARTKVRDPTSLLVLRPQYEHAEPKYSCKSRAL